MGPQVLLACGPVGQLPLDLGGDSQLVLGGLVDGVDADPLGGWLTDADQASPHEGDPVVYAVSAQREFDLLVARARSLVLLHVVAERLRDSCRHSTSDLASFGEQAHVVFRDIHVSIGHGHNYTHICDARQAHPHT